MSLEAQKVIDAIKSCLPDQKGPMALHEPCFAGHEWDYVKDCLDSGWVSSVGGYVDQFERMLAEFTGARFAVATVNGTAALHICLKLADVRPGDEVLVPALTFVATSNAVTYCGATPHFVDSDETSLGVNAASLADYLEGMAEIHEGVCRNSLTGCPIRALVAVHIFGHPADLDSLAEVCARFKIALIEDAAEALGSYYKDNHVGHRGLAGALSFNGNKVITTGGGGAVLCDDAALAKQARHLTTTAKLPHTWRFDHDQVGYNYRLPNINAALGCAQLEQLPGFLAAKRSLAERYRSALKDVGGVRFLHEPEYAHSNFWLNALVIDKENAAERDEILQLGHECGLMMRPTWTLQHKLPMYRNCPRMELHRAQDMEARLINLPSSAGLALNDE